MEKGMAFKIKTLYRNLEQGDDFVFDVSKKYGQCMLIHCKLLQEIGAIYLEKFSNFYTVNVDDKQKFMILYKSNIDKIYDLYLKKVSNENRQLSNS